MHSFSNMQCLIVVSSIRSPADPVDVMPPESALSPTVHSTHVILCTRSAALVQFTISQLWVVPCVVLQISVDHVAMVDEVVTEAAVIAYQQPAPCLLISCRWHGRRLGAVRASNSDPSPAPGARSQVRTHHGDWPVQATTGPDSTSCMAVKGCVDTRLPGNYES